jgi:MoxR-like ATPase
MVRGPETGGYGDAGECGNDGDVNSAGGPCVSRGAGRGHGAGIDGLGGVWVCEGESHQFRFECFPHHRSCDIENRKHEKTKTSGIEYGGADTMSQTFLQQLCAQAENNPDGSLDLSTCRGLLTGLCSQLTSDGESSDLCKKKGMRIVGQDVLVDRIVMSLLMNEHLLLEGLPGVAKTQAVKFLALDTGMINLRVQFFPDMLPSDLVGKTTFDVRALHTAANATAEPSRGDVDIEHWHNGPLFCNLLVADEINRAPSKVQAALLEAMGERQITPLGHATHVIRSDREWEMWLRHIRTLESDGTIAGDIWGSMADPVGALDVDDMDARALQPAVRALDSQRFDRFGDDFPFGRESCWTDPAPLFGASPIHLASGGDAQLTVFATQNPIEQAGTYPMSEAQVDRFNMKHTVSYPDYGFMFPIARMINRPQRENDPDDAYNLPPERELTPVQRAQKDLALRASLYFFRRCRDMMFGPPGRPAQGALGELLGNKVDDLHSTAGRILRLVFYTHFKMSRTARQTEAETLLADPEQQQRMRFLYSNPGVRGDLTMLAHHDAFEYVNSGASPRGWMGMARASLAHAFLKGSGVGINVTDADIRAVAEDVLAHRIRLNSQARVRDLTQAKLLHIVMNVVLDGRQPE